MGQFSREFLHCIDRMTPQAWLIVLAGVILVGIVCMRGFGSRSGY